MKVKIRSWEIQPNPDSLELAQSPGVALQAIDTENGIPVSNMHVVPEILAFRPVISAAGLALRASAVVRSVLQ